MSQDIEWLLKEKYAGEKSDAFFADCKRLALGEPLGYLIGHTPFLDCVIHLDSKPLIPRPETEFWTERVISDIKTNYPAHAPESTPGNQQLRAVHDHDGHVPRPVCLAWRRAADEVRAQCR